MNASEAFTLERFTLGMKPDPRLEIDEWADQHRYLPQQGAAEPGRWRTSRTPYLRQIMKDLSPRSPYRLIVFQKGSQLGGTEVGNNAIGYYIDAAPLPMMMVQPSLNDAKKVSRQRIAPMIESTPRLREKVADPRSRDSGNTQLIKEFPGGLLLITGANSDKGLRSTPAAFLFCDEIDAYPIDVAGQGDPVALAMKRTATFPFAKTFLNSTPTIKDISRIEREFLRSDQKYYHVPCPYCKEKQSLNWDGLKWQKDPAGDPIPESVRYQCEICGKLIEEGRHKTWMLENGTWVAANPNAPEWISGFKLPSIYSPLGWKSWPSMVEDWAEAQQDRMLLKTFINTTLGDTWNEDPDRADAGDLMGRREEYAEIVPQAANVITCGVDVQADRLEVETVAWASGRESWNLNWIQFYGNPEENEVWEQLDDYLLTRWTHDSGWKLPIACTCIDSGAFTTSVYRYVRGKSKRRVFATKGSSAVGKPLVAPPTRTNTYRVPVFLIGTDTGKDAVYARLKIDQPGPGYMHFHEGLDKEYFRQLMSEVAKVTYYQGRPVRRYVVKSGVRNEVIDCRVLNLAALEILKPNFDSCARRLTKEPPPPSKDKPKGAEVPVEQKTLKVKQRRVRPPRGSKFIDRF